MGLQLYTFLFSDISIFLNGLVLRPLMALVARATEIFESLL
jgi:hypothetical protein